MDELLQVKNQFENQEFEYTIALINEGNKEVNAAITSLENELDRINHEIDGLTNHADYIDNTVAVASGILCGLIDIIFVGEFSFERANEWGTEKTNKFIIKIAKAKGYKGDDLEGAVRFLEKEYPIPADKVTSSFGGGLQHHLNDFSHHPTPVGLFFSLLTQFTKKVYGTSTAGTFIVVPLSEDALFLIGKNTHEKITFGVINWFFHMVSDMGGSSTSLSQNNPGTGLPGPIGALLKELSALPIFKKVNERDYKKFSVLVSKLFNGELLDVKFDLRTEIGVAHELGRQAVPVLINECVVRGFYFIRRFIDEVRDSGISRFSDLKSINWSNTLPAKNRTIIRMLTISSGTFVACDMLGAAINTLISANVNSITYVRKFILSVNFVGIGRFAIALKSDWGLERKKDKLEDERSLIQTQLLFYKEAKVFYRIGNTWKKVENADIAIKELSDQLQGAWLFTSEAVNDMNKSSLIINENMGTFRNMHPELVSEIKRLIEEV